MKTKMSMRSKARLAKFNSVETLHELLAIAIEDFACAVESKNMRIDTGEWVRQKAKTCSVCVAGAVIYFRQMGDLDSVPLDGRHHAIDALRRGNISRAAVYFAGYLVGYGYMNGNRYARAYQHANFDMGQPYATTKREARSLLEDLRRLHAHLKEGDL